MSDVVRTEIGRKRAKKMGPRDERMTRVIDPPALTKPGEKWHLNGFSMDQVIVVREGPDARGRTYVDGRHQLTIAKFETVRDAMAGIQAFNGFNALVDIFLDARTAEDFHDMAAKLFKSFGRIP